MKASQTLLHVIDPFPHFCLVLQKNWLCASQDDSLLPPTALAEMTVEDYFNTTLCSTCAFALLSFFDLLLLFLSLFFLLFTFLHCSWQRKLMWLYAPCGQLDIWLNWNATFYNPVFMQQHWCAWTTLKRKNKTDASSENFYTSSKRRLRIIKKEPWDHIHECLLHSVLKKNVYFSFI